jgi:heat shock protein HtpX
MFSTHPDTSNRIAALEAIAAELGHSPAVTPVADARRVAAVPRSTRRRRSSALDPLGEA